ncbi:MAG: hypothetical protein J6J30_00890, partial [Clostridia bacterium]|nr:hypothetical protein [Clostridia bacterium]
MIRQINYTVSEKGLSPATVQFGGVQGEHKATALNFTIEDGLLASLKSLKEKNGGKLIYRIDRYNGEGNFWPSDNSDLT